mgnify:CR=1 FL=1
MDKINEKSAGVYLARHYGEIKDEIHRLSVLKNFAGILQAIVNYLKLLLEKRQLNKLGTRIKTIGPLHKKGNDYLKYIIENLFVRSFEGIRRRCTAEEWAALYKEIPSNLKNIYLQQAKENTQNKWIV